METAASGKRRRGRPRIRKTEVRTAPVAALDRGLQVLEVLARHDGIALSELATALDLPAATAHRLLTTLAGRGLAVADPAEGGWSVGIGAFRIGSAFLARTGLVAAAGAAMDGLLAETGETAGLWLPDGAVVVLAGQVETAAPVRAGFPIGARAPVHAAAAGKAVLATRPRAAVESVLAAHRFERFTEATIADGAALIAELERTRRRGFAIEAGEHAAGLHAVAAPVHDAYGAALAAVAICGPGARFGEAAVGGLGAAVRRAAAAVSERLGGRGRVA